MQYKFGISIALGVFLLLPFHQAFASVLWCDPLFGLCSNPYGNVSTEVPQNLKVTAPQPYTPPLTVPIKLNQVVIPPSATATLGTNAVQCTLDPTSCKTALNAQTQCTQGGGTWTPYPMSSVLWPGSYCQTTVISTATVSHRSSLTTAQISSIISLLQAFGADAKTIVNVQSALGQ